MLIQTNHFDYTKNLTLVTQSEAKSLEDVHMDVHESLHCTPFRMTNCVNRNSPLERG